MLAVISAATGGSPSATVLTARAGTVGNASPMTDAQNVTSAREQSERPVFREPSGTNRYSGIECIAFATDQPLNPDTPTYKRWCRVTAAGPAVFANEERYHHADRRCSEKEATPVVLRWELLPRCGRRCHGLVPIEAPATGQYLSIARARRTVGRWDTFPL